MQVKRAAYENMQSIAFQHSGVIYGGYVRDTIISQHYSSLYEEQTSDKKNINKFWNKDHHPETRDRCLLPADMDVMFASLQDADEFIDAVKDTREYNRVSVNTKQGPSYYSPLIHSVRKVSIQILVGEIPFISYGKVVQIYVDVVVPKSNITLQAPFGNLDMLCNGFIMTKDAGIIYSRNTGTVIDHYSDAKRAIIVAGIIKDMLQFKTYLSFTTRNKSIYAANLTNKIALQRIRKMERKQHKKWTFINLPFKSEVYKHTHLEDCVICSTEFEKDDIVDYTVSKKEDGTTVACAKSHHICFMLSLGYQLSDNLYESQGWAFKCPFRNIIDFNLCQLDIEPACTAYMK